MSAELPQYAQQVLGGDTPIHGHGDETEPLQRRAAELADHADAYRDALRAARLALGGNRGRGVEVLAVRLARELAPGAAVVRESALQTAEALGAYAAEVALIHSEARRVLHDAQENLTTLGIHARLMDDIATELGVALHLSLHEMPPAVMPEPAGVQICAVPGAETEAELEARALRERFEQPWAASAAVWRECAHQLAAAVTRWHVLLDDRARIERQLVAALTQTTIAQLVSLGGADGVRSVALMLAGVYRGEQVSATLPIPQHAWVHGDLDPAEVASQWRELGREPGDVASLPLPMLVALAGTNGVPAWAQNEAARRLLELAQLAPEVVYGAMGISPEHLRITEFTQQVEQLRRALAESERVARSMRYTPEVQLVSLGHHDGALTAAISLGDLDRATHVGVNVAGMGSGVSKLFDSVQASREVYLAAQSAQLTQSYAVVAWMGYRAPQLPPGDLSVLGMSRAEAGGERLAGFLDGVAASRTETDAEPARLAVLAHSYGSTTAAEALQLVSSPVDAFVAFGSAGFASDVRAAELRVERIYATTADGDGVARIGVVLGGRVDPRDLPGVAVLSAEPRANAAGVTAHTLYAGVGARSLVNPLGTVGYQSPGSISVMHMGRIVAGGEVE